MINSKTFNNTALYAKVLILVSLFSICSIKYYEINPIFSVCISVSLLVLILLLFKLNINYNKHDNDNDKNKDCMCDLKELAKCVINEDKLKTRKIKIYNVLANVSNAFLCSNDPNNGKVEQLLTEIVKAFNINSGFMYKIDKESDCLIRTYEYKETDNNICVFETFTYESAIKTLNVLKNNKPIKHNDIYKDEFKNIFQHCKFQTIILIPIHVDNKFTGFMGFEGNRNKIWNEKEIQILNIVSKIFASWCSKRKLIEILNNNKK